MKTNSLVKSLIILPVEVRYILVMNSINGKLKIELFLKSEIAHVNHLAPNKYKDKLFS